MDERFFAFLMAMINGGLALISGIALIFFYMPLAIIFILASFGLIIGGILAKSHEERIAGWLIAVCGIISVPLGIAGIIGGIKLLKAARYGFKGEKGSTPQKKGSGKSFKPVVQDAMIKYVEQCMNMGKSEQEIKTELVKVGHPKNVIDQAFKQLSVNEEDEQESSKED
jgi:hypothetical protein